MVYAWSSYTNGVLQIFGNVNEVIELPATTLPPSTTTPPPPIPSEQLKIYLVQSFSAAKIDLHLTNIFTPQQLGKRL